jgi:hypothetical protein
MTMNTATIIRSTEIRRHNGQCAFGEWLTLDEADHDTREAVVAEVQECQCRDMRREAGNGNTEYSGRVRVNGQIWIYRA